MTVYFIQNHKGNIKIGYTSKIYRRLTELRASDGPIVVLAIIDGEVEAEKAIQLEFINQKIIGKNDWFRPSPELLDYISGIAWGYPPKEKTRQIPIYLPDKTMVEVLQKLAESLGYIQSGGGGAGTGSISKLLQAIAEGKVKVEKNDQGILKTRCKIY